MHILAVATATATAAREDEEEEFLDDVVFKPAFRRTTPAPAPRASPNSGTIAPSREGVPLQNPAPLIAPPPPVERDLAVAPPRRSGPPAHMFGQAPMQVDWTAHAPELTHAPLSFERDRDLLGHGLDLDFGFGNVGLGGGGGGGGGLLDPAGSFPTFMEDQGFFGMLGGGWQPEGLGLWFSLGSTSPFHALDLSVRAHSPFAPEFPPPSLRQSPLLEMNTDRGATGVGVGAGVGVGRGVEVAGRKDVPPPPGLRGLSHQQLSSSSLNSLNSLNR
mmetsp:Transcript_31996/g.72756  ORF Transcript_31996/g.72756 Transcript_31996/m.72756 type:complete len:274 (+) Transcript_31996:514-1335(+)